MGELLIAEEEAEHLINENRTDLRLLAFGKRFARCQFCIGCGGFDLLLARINATCSNAALQRLLGKQRQAGKPRAGALPGGGR